MKAHRDHQSDEDQEIWDAFDIEEWLETESIDFKKARGHSGMQLQLRECPDCADSRWRCYINAETGMGNCFVCNETFNKFKVVKLISGLSWKDAKTLARQFVQSAGWRPKKTVSNAIEYAEIKLPLSFELPTVENRNLVYLERRGISGDMAKYFHLRYCVGGWWNYEIDGQRKGQNFEGRVIIPVFDLDGVLRTFQGRDVTDSSDRKYLFPTGLPGTGRYLYNGYNAIRHKKVAMGEGAFDVFAIKRAFDEDADLRSVAPIGSFGKHLSYGSMNGDDQLARLVQLKRQGLEQVTIMWDGERAALSSALLAAKLIHGSGIEARIALLPQDKDPAEVDASVVRDAFRQAIVYTPSNTLRLMLKSPYK